MRSELNKKVKGFTIVELLITMVLTSISITFAYGTLTYVQKLFSMTQEQQRFIQDYTNLNTRLSIEISRAEFVRVINDRSFEINKDSLITNVEISEKYILLKSKELTDTFHLNAGKIEKLIIQLPIKNQYEYLRELKFPVKYSDREFNFYFYKEYDAALVMKLVRKTDGRN